MNKYGNSSDRFPAVELLEEPEQRGGLPDPDRSLEVLDDVGAVTVTC
jgi:hypothetical protein